MLVPSMFPALMSTVGSVAVPVVLSVVNAPVLAEFAPIGVPSIAPPFTSIEEMKIRGRHVPSDISCQVPVTSPVTAPVDIAVTLPVTAPLHFRSRCLSGWLSPLLLTSQQKPA